jgi:hypothetical protein
MTSFASTDQILWNFKVHRKIKISKAFLKKTFTGQICPERAEASGFGPDLVRQQRRSNLPAGPGHQRPLDTESVSADFGRPIRRTIDGAGPSSPSRRWLDGTLALTTGDGEVKLTEGCRGWLGWLQGGGGLSEACSASETCRRGCSRVVRGCARSRGPRAPSTMVAFSCCQRGNERQGEV